jgi:hypothetical protein
MLISYEYFCCLRIAPRSTPEKNKAHEERDTPLRSKSVSESTRAEMDPSKRLKVVVLLHVADAPGKAQGLAAHNGTLI